MKRKLVVLSAIAFSTIALISFEGVSEADDGGGDGGGGGSSSYEMNPPIATSIYIQKLAAPLGDGSNVKMMVDYTFPDGSHPPTINVYTGSDESTMITFRDDGIGADAVAGDGEYSAYLAENIPQLESTISSRVAAINARPVNLTFSGRDGTELTSPITVSLDAFEAGERMHIPTGLLVGLDCADAIDKARSLFITDLSVVEDPARTYNILTPSAGNPNGLYTFGNLFKQIANESVTGITPSKLMKSWVQNWVTNTSVGSQVVPARTDVITYLIGPWLNAAGDPHTITAANWSSEWDATDETALLQNAPFKLTAIVNRIDLRGNSGYGTTMNHAGETRFIFTLIAPHASGTTAAGQPPCQDNQDFIFPDDHDWRGMNVIFEYGNVQTNICDVRAFAQKWLALSSQTLGSLDYNDSLESITKTVINANAAPGKINGSAIDRIRTNERIFQNPGGRDNNSWRASDWEFRQFELDPSTNEFKEVTLTNTPVNSANSSFYDYDPYIGNLGAQPSVSLSGADQNNLIDWAFSSPFVTASIIRGNYNMPDVYSGSPLTAASGRVDGEWAHYWDLAWPNTTTHYDPTTFIYGPIPASYEQMRHQISLNTCQGCHAGETKTLFTQVVPLSYGESNQYWTAAPDYQYARGTDTRFTTNYGSTSISDADPVNYNPPPNSGFNCYNKVSGFLTGRAYRGIPSSIDYSDDKTDDANDDNISGLYYVNSPNNGDDGLNPQVQYGYNDLQRRAQDMCTLVDNNCGISVLTTATVVSHAPLALGTD